MITTLMTFTGRVSPLRQLPVARSYAADRQQGRLSQQPLPGGCPDFVSRIGLKNHEHDFITPS